MHACLGSALEFCFKLQGCSTSAPLGCQRCEELNAIPPTVVCRCLMFLGP